MHRRLGKILTSLGVIAALAAAGQASDKGIDASASLETKMQVSQEIGNVFSRTTSFQIDGFDAYVARASGTGIYKVQQVSPQQIVMSASFLYDGRPVSTGENIIKDGGRTICWKSNCSTATDASGVSFNPLLWGVPKGKLHVGQSWNVEIAVPWELGPAGKQVVKVLSIDPSDDTITLEREGSGEGAAADEVKKLPLVKDKKTYVVDVTAGKTKWSGFTTFRRGVVLSDVLLMERSVTTMSAEMGQSNGTERQYILLNSVPPDLLRR